MSRIAPPPVVGRTSTRSSLAGRSLAPDGRNTVAPRGGWGAAAVGVWLVAEFVALTLAFDTGTIATHRPVLEALVGFAPELLRIGLVGTIFAGLLVGPGQLIELLREFRTRAILHPARGTWWLAHVVAMFAFASVTWSVCHAGRLAGPFDLVWFAAWAALGVAVVGTALGSLAPLGFLTYVLRRHAVHAVVGLLLGGLAWGAGELTRAFWGDLTGMTFAGVTLALETIGLDVRADAATHVIGTAGFRVQVAPACSGYEGLGLVLAFVTGFLVVCRRDLRFPSALVLLPIGAVLALVGNVLRIALLIAIGTTVSPDLALGGFHSQAGWLAFIGIAIGLMALGLGTPFVRRRAAVPNRPAEPTSVAPVRTTVFLLPFLVWLAAGMLFDALCPSAALAYGGKTLAAGIALWCCRSSLRAVSWRITPIGVLLGIGTFVVWATAGWFEADPNAAPLPVDPWWIGLRLVGSVLLVPVIEELAFRGYAMRRLVATDFDGVTYDAIPMWAILVSSIAFGLLHGWWVAGTLAGLVLGLTARRRGLGDAIIAHAVANALVATAVIWGGWTWLW